MLNYRLYICVALILSSILIGCEDKPHQIFNRDIAENEITDGNVVFVKPDFTDFSYEYVNDHYSICMKHPKDTLTTIVLFSDVLKWYQGIEFHEQVELYKEHYTNNCVIEKESESTKHLYNAEMHTYHVSVVKSNVHMIGELSVIYNKSERKRCVIESMHLPEDKIVNEIIKTLRYK